MLSLRIIAQEIDFQMNWFYVYFSDIFFTN